MSVNTLELRELEGQEKLAQKTHLAVIMDGNRRWAKKRGLSSLEGHKAGVDALKNLVSLAPSYGISVLTAYAFSTENWKRTDEERSFIFSLLEKVAIKELGTLHKNNVRVSFLGDLSAFPDEAQKALKDLEAKTKNNSGLHLQLALNYGSLSEFKKALVDLKTELEDSEITNISEKDFSKSLYTEGTVDPDFLVRTGGDRRLSNYLLWQGANSDLRFLDTLWPDFSEEELKEVLGL